MKQHALYREMGAEEEVMISGEERVHLDVMAKPVQVNLFDLYDPAVTRMVHSWNLSGIVLEFLKVVY